MIGRTAHADDWRARRTGGATAGLAFGVGQAVSPIDLRGMISTPNRYLTEFRSLCNGGQARFLKRQLSLPVSTMSQ
jgi:hypothetical protein